MLKTIIFSLVGAIVIAIAIVLILAAGKPNTFRVERSVTINAAPDKIFPLISDFHNWADWSPFDKMDPTMEKTYSGASQGKGAVYAWEGKGRSGKGQMEIVEATLNKITIKLNFSKPMKSLSTVEYTIAPAGDATQVTWAMYGPNSYVAKIFHVFMNMNKMMNKTFDEGLAKLKEIAEKK